MMIHVLSLHTNYLEISSVSILPANFLINYHILPVNSRGYYKLLEIGAATNQDFYIETARKV